MMMGNEIMQGLVMAGLVPAIHALSAVRCSEDVDARHKAGHDGGERGAKQ